MNYTIYQFLNKVTDKPYIGCTKWRSREKSIKAVINRKKHNHLWKIKKGRTSSLYRDINKYGINNFEISEIITFDWTPKAYGDMKPEQVESFIIQQMGLDNIINDHDNINRGGIAHTIVNEEQVLEIHNSKLRHCQIANKLGISQNIVKQIRNGSNWNHITGLPKRNTAPRKKR